MNAISFERHVLKAPMHENTSPADGEIVFGNCDAIFDDNLCLVRQPGLASLLHGLGQLICSIGRRLGIVAGRVDQKDAQLVGLAVRAL
jgi:hypothetical protein